MQTSTFLWAVLAACLVTLLPDGNVQAASLSPARDCVSTPPVTVDSARLPALYKVLNAAPGATKSEWETTNAYLDRRQAALNDALARSEFNCPRIVLMVPIVWKFDADTGLLITSRFGLSPREEIEPGSLEADLGPNTGSIFPISTNDIFIGDSFIEAAFDFEVHRYNAAPRPKSASFISDCLKKAAMPGWYMGRLPYDVETSLCRDQFWNVTVRVSGERKIPGSYEVSLEEAKRARSVGLFLFLDISLSHNYIGVDERMNNWLVFSTLNDAWIGDASGDRVGVPVVGPPLSGSIPGSLEDGDLPIGTARKKTRP